MRIGIDFDGVLFDTASFKKFLESKFPGYNETYTRTNNIYDPRKHSEELGVSQESLFEVLDESHKFLRKDIDLLGILNNYEKIVVSRGPLAFQQRKIKNSGVTNYIDDFVIVKKEPKTVANIDLLIDDNPDELRSIDVPGFEFDTEHHSIQQIIDFIKDQEQSNDDK